MSLNRELASATLAHLAALDVHHVVVCAGARNAPLITSLLKTGESGTWSIHPHFDERSAAFFSLGLAKKTRQPVAIVTTSGTAVAELLPAAVEAYYSGVPLVLVTADRPSRYRGSGAPQAIEQVGIFGDYAPVSLDIEGPMDLSGVERWNRDEPLHLNVCFEEPQPDEAIDSFPAMSIDSSAIDSSAEGAEILEGFLAKSSTTVVLVGELEADWRSEVERFLSELGAPVWAEATSGLRESSLLRKVLIRQERCLSTFDAGSVLRIGGVPSLRFWRDLESRKDVAVLSISRRPFSGLARDSRLVLTPRFPVPGNPTQQGQVTDSTLLSRPDFEELLARYPKSEPALVRALSKRIPSGAMVFLGNSLPIREWNLAASLDCPHSHCFASRGANGIDGQLATFLGMSHGEKESWGVFGDLTTLYDLNAPALVENISSGKRRFVVINNGGGCIFSRLPSMASLAAEEKEVTENRHERSFQSWASMWGMEYFVWSGEGTIPESESDNAVLEIRPSEEETESFWSEWK